MSPLSTLALSGLLALISTLSEAAPIAPQSRQPAKRASKLPSFPVVHSFSLSAPPAGAPRLVDVDRARFASHLTRVGAHDMAAQVTNQLHGFPFGGFGGGQQGQQGQGNGQGQGAGGASGSSNSTGTGSGTGTGTASGTNGTEGAGTDIKVTNAVVSYNAQVQVGTQTFNLLIDTGSSNTWVGADPANPYKAGSTSKSTNEQVSVTYGSGSFSGEEFIDTVNLSGGLSVNNQSIGVASQATGFDGVDGILGVGPIALTAGTLSGSKTQTIPTITDSLKADGKIATEVMGVSFVPSTVAQDNQNGVLTFGGVDESAFVGDITFQPITKTAPASSFWGADISLDQSGTKLSGTMAGILDTGTTLFLLADDIFQQYASSIPGATLDQTTGLVQIPAASVNKIPTLNVNYAGTTFPLSGDAQVFPSALNTALGGQNGFAYSIVSSLGTNSGQGLDFIFGMTAMERFYTVCDTTNQQTGIAFTKQTNESFFNATPGQANTNVAANYADSTSAASPSLKRSAKALSAISIMGALVLMA